MKLNKAHPPVSIGMPVYNGERFIGKALDSILQQSYPYFQLLISDNCSTDRTAEICREYAARDSRIKYVRQSTNLGATANFRYVLDASVHERFIWAAADDWWNSDRLEHLVSALRPQDAVVSGAVRAYVDETPVAEFVPISFAKGNWWRFLLREESRCEKTYYVYGLIWKDNAIDVFSEDFGNYWGDSIFCYRLLWKGHLTSVQGAALHVAKHPGSSGTKEAAKFRYSIARLVCFAHPFTYYKRYAVATPGRHRYLVALAIPAKALMSQLHLWWRALYRIVLGRPFVHGALPGGARVMQNAKL